MTTDPAPHGPTAEPGEPALHAVADGVHAWVQPDGSWWLNNAGIVTDGERTLVVDTCATEARTTRFLAAAAEAAPTPAMAMNTHAHGDHTYGNGQLPASATLIGHENMRRTLLADPLIEGCPPVWAPTPDWGAVTRRVPDVTTATDLTVHLGERRVEVRHPGGTAHTDGDLVAWVPDVGVLFTGDLLFHGLTPLVFQGSVEGARRSLDWIAAFEPTHVVPGHGPLLAGTHLAGVLDEHDRYYDLVLRTARAGIAAGRSPLEAARDVDLAGFAAWADAERIVLNLHRAYDDLGAGPFDVQQSIADAMEWNGGPMTTHVCCWP